MIDNILHRDMGDQWLPFFLQVPLKYKSMDPLCTMMNAHLDWLIRMTEEPTDSGGVYNSLPIEFFMYHPLLMKFMFFKWGHYFVGTEEFDDFSSWNVPDALVGLREKVEQICLRKALYILDSSLIWALASEVENFNKMHIITKEEKEALRGEMHDQLTKLEHYIKGTFNPEVLPTPKTEFYVCMVNAGFTSIYHASDKECAVLFQTSFRESFVSDCRESYERMKEWIKSIRYNSVLISGSGSIERRLYFEKQHNIIDHILK